MKKFQRRKKSNQGLPFYLAIPVSAAVFVLVFALAFQALTSSGQGQVAGVQSGQSLTFWERLLSQLKFWERPAGEGSAGSSSGFGSLKSENPESDEPVEETEDSSVPEPETADENEAEDLDSSAITGTSRGIARDSLGGASDNSGTGDLEAELRETADDGGQSEFDKLKTEEESL